MAPPGLTALGAKGSVRDRLTPPGRVEGSALGRYIVSLRWRGVRPYGQAPLGLEGSEGGIGTGTGTGTWAVLSSIPEG